MPANPYQALQQQTTQEVRAAHELAARAKAMARLERFMAEAKTLRVAGDTKRLVRLERAIDWLALRMEQNFGY